MWKNSFHSRGFLTKSEKISQILHSPQSVFLTGGSNRKYLFFILIVLNICIPAQELRYREEPQDPLMEYGRDWNPDETNGWLPVSVTYTNKIGGVWNPTSRRDYTYYSDGRRMYFTLSYYQNGIFNLTDEFSYIYDSAGNNTERIQLTWDGTFLTNIRKRIYTYTDNRIVYSERLVWEDSTWVIEWKTWYNYNDLGQLAVQNYERYLWGSLFSRSRYVYTYDENGNLVTEMYQYPDNEIWMSRDSTQYSYNEFNRKVSEWRYIFENNQWVLKQKGLWEYNSFQDISVVYWISPNISNLTIQHKYFYYYDENRNLMEIFEQYDGGGGVFVDASREVYQYGDFPLTGTDQSAPYSAVLYQNYPNPFNGATRISYSIDKPGRITLRIYDVLGRLQSEPVNGYHEPGEYHVNFETGNMASGVYYYELLSGDSRRQVKKFILTR